MGEKIAGKVSLKIHEQGKAGGRPRGFIFSVKVVDVRQGNAESRAGTAG